MKPVKQLVNRQTPFNQDCCRPSAKPSLEESAHISLVPFANTNGLLDDSTLSDSFKNPATYVVGNMLGSSGSQRISEDNKLFPSIHNMDINLELDPATVDQFSIENNIVLQRDWTSAEETFGTDSFNWIEDLMASDLPSLEYDWPREEAGATATLTDLSSSPNTLFDWSGMALNSTDVAPVETLDLGFQSYADPAFSYGTPQNFAGFSQDYSNNSLTSPSSSGSPFGAQTGSIARSMDQQFNYFDPILASPDVDWSGRLIDVEQRAQLSIGDSIAWTSPYVPRSFCISGLLLTRSQAGWRSTVCKGASAWTLGVWTYYHHDGGSLRSVDAFSRNAFNAFRRKHRNRNPLNFWIQTHNYQAAAGVSSQIQQLSPIPLPRLRRLDLALLKYIVGLYQFRHSSDHKYHVNHEMQNLQYMTIIGSLRKILRPVGLHQLLEQ